MAIFTAGAGTSVEPLAIIKEGQVAGATIRVPLNCIDLCRVNTRAAEKVCVCFLLEMLVNFSELKYFICFLSSFYNQTQGKKQRMSLQSRQ